MLKKIIKVLSILSTIFIISINIIGIEKSINGITFFGVTSYYGLDAFNLSMLCFILGIPYITIPTYVIILIDLIVNRTDKKKFFRILKISLLLLLIITISTVN